MLSIDKFAWQKSLRGADLTHAEFRILTMMATYTDGQGRNAFPGVQRLAEDAVMDRRTAQRSIAQLLDKGWLVEVERGGNDLGYRRANVYELTMPPHRAEVKSGPDARRAVAMHEKGGEDVPEGRREATPPDPLPGHVDQTMDHSANSRRPRAVVDPASQQAVRRRDSHRQDWEAIGRSVESLVDWLEQTHGPLSSPEEAMAESMFERYHPRAIANAIEKAELTA